MPFECDSFIDWMLDEKDCRSGIFSSMDIQYQYDMLKEKGFCTRTEVRSAIKKLYKFMNTYKVDVFIY